MHVKAVFAANLYAIPILPYLVVNEMGKKLLSSCKSNGLRIVNGRPNLGMTQDYTLNWSKGRCRLC